MWGIIETLKLSSKVFATVSEIPFIAIKVADNQKDIFDYLVKNNNFNVLDGFSSEKLKIMLNKITF